MQTNTEIGAPTYLFTFDKLHCKRNTMLKFCWYKNWSSWLRIYKMTFKTQIISYDMTKPYCFIIVVAVCRRRYKSQPCQYCIVASDIGSWCNYKKLSLFAFLFHSFLYFFFFLFISISFIIALLLPDCLVMVILYAK